MVVSMKRTLYISMLLLLVASCTERTVDISTFSDVGARTAAEHFYDMLGRGKAEKYVENMYESSAMDSSMHAQYVDMMGQFLHEERQSTGGILSAKSIRDTIVDSVALVFLDVQFADSTNEEIMLPLVYSQGRWWIK